MKDLYEEYYFIDEVIANYPISHIHSKLKIYISPVRNPSIREKITLHSYTFFRDFLDYNRVDIAESIILPSYFSKYNAFAVKIVFMNKFYKFIIHMLIHHFNRKICIKIIYIF